MTSLFISCNEQEVDFNTHIRPILNKNCVACHGGVRQNAEYGLIFREEALGETKNGNIGIVPGHPEKSELISRITHKDPDMRMPPERAPLKKEEIDLLTEWIKQGARWQEHWAYTKPIDPKTPRSNNDWVKNDIDAFVLEKIKDQNLTPSKQAQPSDLIRRVYLDLTGLPPTWEQIEAYKNDQSEEAFEMLVDTLLASEKFGEHWATMWLDLARYADSKGYEQDGGRQIWKYRDWVIKAFNDDKPFDVFTIEQLAGDLLPNATLDQLVATAFHRNTMNNDEGGTHNEEYRNATVIDRVNTTYEVFQSLTMACVQCHSHPYEPIRHKEYYQSMAFFNNTSDWDIGTEVPLLKELDSINQIKLDEIKSWISDRSNVEQENSWEKFILTGEPRLRPEDFGETKNVVHRNRSGQDYMEITSGSQIKINQVALKDVDRIYFKYSKSTDISGSLIIRKGHSAGPIIGQTQLPRTSGFNDLSISIQPTAETADLYVDFKSKSSDFNCTIDGFLLGYKLPGLKDGQYAKTYQKIDELLNTPAERTTPILIEKPISHSRKTTIFERGSWLVLGNEVEMSIPIVYDSIPPELNNRLDFARWLVSDKNPLTGRVMVNRFWEKIFGSGIVTTVEDFGSQGSLPTHPKLLDWLAVRFSGEWEWSVKKLLKTMVMSATYRQSSTVSEDALMKDPDNIWLARSSRIRLSAEQVRDQALAVSGLLSNKMFGPSVMPYQPDGVWSVVYNNANWVTSEGEDAYRRGIYTYLRRTSPYPSLITFDAAEREVCLSRRINTNTPLQALVTLNDPVYLEAAKNLAQRVYETEKDSLSQIVSAYQRVMGKEPNPERSNILLALINETKVYYNEHPDELKSLTETGDSHLASLIVMTNTLMNLDEFIMKN